MRIDDPSLFSAWRARLDLDFEARAGRTVLARRSHDGPLQVQRMLYPEGGVCHGIVLHPPAGVAGGDELRLAVRCAPHARALLTTPGAGKWYRSAGPWARQAIDFDVATDAALEWLPQPTIVFDGAQARSSLAVNLASSAAYIGWEILCLGRTGSGERFAAGHWRFASGIVRDGRPLWREAGSVEGGAELLQCAPGLGGHPVAGTLAASAPGVDAFDPAPLRALRPSVGDGSVTRLPGVLLCRYLGASSEAAMNYFTHAWTLLRPALLGRAACPPRIWRT